MENDYTIRKTFRVNNRNISVYFSDNTKQPLFSMIDVARYFYGSSAVSSRNVAKFVVNGTVTKIRTVAKYDILVCDLQGLREIAHAATDEQAAEEFIKEAVQFIGDQMRLIPGPLKVTKGIQQISSKNYFLMVTALNDHSVRFVRIDSVRWFPVQDIVRSFTGMPAETIEDCVGQLAGEDICDITFKNGETRRCISETGVLQVLTTVVPQESVKLGSQLVSACNALENNDTIGIKAVLKDLIVDGAETDIMRYTLFTAKSVKIIALRYDKESVITMFNVKDAAVKVKADITKCNYMAAEKSIVFVSDDQQLYVTLDELRDILLNKKGCAILIDELKESVKENNIIQRTLEMTDISLPLNTITRETLQKIIKKDLNKNGNRTRELRVKENAKNYNRNLETVYYEYAKISDHDHCLVCVMKDSRDGSLRPMLWTKDVGILLDITYVPTLVNRICDPEEFTKVDIPGTSANGGKIKLISVNGFKQLLDWSKIKDKQATTLWAEVQKVTQEVLKKYFDNKEGESIVEEKKQEEIVAEQETQENDAGGNDISSVKAEDTVDVQGKPVRIAIVAEEGKGILVYYDYEQLCESLDIKAENLGDFKKHKDMEGKDTLISILDLTDALKNAVPDAAAFVQKLFNDSKIAIGRMAQAIGLEVKTHDTSKASTATEDSTSNLFKSSDGRTYILGAIILAEKYRALCLALQANNVNFQGLPGPSNNKLINDLWKYIDCQAPDQNASFGFQKQVLAVNERYRQMQALLED